MKKLFFAAMAVVAMMMVSCGGTKTENVTGDMKKDAAKCVEIMNKSGEVTNEDSKIMEEIAAYYEGEGKAKEFEKEFQDQFTKALTGDLDKAFEEGMKELDEAGDKALDEISKAAEELK